MWNNVPMTLRTGDSSDSFTQIGTEWRNGRVFYRNLPTFIQSRLPMYGTSDINTSEENTLVLKTKMTAYMIRATNWNSGKGLVDLDGWTLLGNGPYLGDHDMANLYEKIMDPGKYIIDNFAAMYLFSKFLKGSTFKYLQVSSIFIVWKNP